MKKKSSKANFAEKERSRGRRPLSSPPINKDTILETGLALAQTVPLQDLSIVRIATELGVTPANIRYHSKSRDELTAGIVILFYKYLLSHWPVVSGNWRTDLSAVSKLIYSAYIRYAGIAAYFAAGNRFQILANAMRTDAETMAQFLEHYFAVMRQIGLDTKRTNAYAVILLQQLNFTAHATNSQQWPGEQKLTEKHLKSIDPHRFPHTTEMRESYLNMAGDVAFEAMLNLTISGLEQERVRGALVPSPMD